jgi:hypothetical protein
VKNDRMIKILRRARGNVNQYFGQLDQNFRDLSNSKTDVSGELACLWAFLRGSREVVGRRFSAYPMENRACWVTGVDYNTPSDVPGYAVVAAGESP